MEIGGKVCNVSFLIPVMFAEGNIDNKYGCFTFFFTTKFYQAVLHLNQQVLKVFFLQDNIFIS